MAYKVLDVANRLLQKMSEVSNGTELMTNMKLQKMLYYQQGFHLAAFDTPLFDDEIEAWMYGPVVPSVYEHYRSYGKNGIAPSEDVLEFKDRIEESLFDEVFDVYGIYSATGLMEMTHSETPWMNTEVGSGNVISKNLIRSFFKTRLSRGEGESGC